MKKILFTLTLAAVCGSVAAQDQIVKRNAEDIQAKVIRVTQTTIEYHRWDNLEGPVYELPVGEVLFIKYQNGTKDTFNQAPANSRYTQTGPGPAYMPGQRPGNRRYGFHPQPKEAARPERQFSLRYQGEAAFGFGLGVGALSREIGTNRIAFETVHGVRFCPYFFAGLGLGYNYFYSEVAFYENNHRYTAKGAGALPYFVNAKGYFPLSDKCSLYLSLDLGAASGVQGYLSGTEFYTAVGPGISFGNAKGFPRGDFGIRFQHMGEGLNAVLFRVAFGF